MINLHIVSSEFDVWNDPVVDFVLPAGPRFHLHVLHSRDELIDNEVLETDFSRQLSNTVHQILPLTMHDLCNVVQLVLGHAIAGLNTLDLSVSLL